MIGTPLDRTVPVSHLNLIAAVQSRRAGLVVENAALTVEGFDIRSFVIAIIGATLLLTAFRILTRAD